MMTIIHCVSLLLLEIDCIVLPSNLPSQDSGAPWHLNILEEILATHGEDHLGFQDWLKEIVQKRKSINWSYIYLITYKIWKLWVGCPTHAEHIYLYKVWAGYIDYIIQFSRWCFSFNSEWVKGVFGGRHSWWFNTKKAKGVSTMRWCIKNFEIISSNIHPLSYFAKKNLMRAL